MSAIDDIMEQASAALERTDYLTCEQLCTQALGLARQQHDFDAFARILLPLQEARRQRRQIATDHGVTVLSTPRIHPADILDRHPVGCLLLIDPPYSAADEQALRDLARERRLMVQALRLDAATLRRTFEQQLEALGDTALASVPRDLTAIERLDALTALLDRVGDHEIIHQRLAQIARHLAAQ
jgi:hypothetical protein